jgi:hypothetical protein
MFDYPNWLRSWVQIPPGPSFPVVQIRYWFEVILIICSRIQFLCSFARFSLFFALAVVMKQERVAFYSILGYSVPSYPTVLVKRHNHLLETCDYQRLQDIYITFITLSLFLLLFSGIVKARTDFFLLLPFAPRQG